jgi:CRISPR/Cas system CSM-associated protein Csm5 (group 7 of RAMP superfamily)
MNYQLTVNTLRPVHIGNGEELHENLDYRVFNKFDTDGNEERFVGIWDQKKIVKAIGPNQFSRYISLVNKGESPVELIKAAASGLKIDSLYKRKVEVVHPQPVKVVKECIHTGLGKLYIPGTSLKGAILTALIVHSLEDQDINIHNLKPKDRLTDAAIMEKAVGRDMGLQPNRFLQVPDISFAEWPSQVWYAGTFNLKGDAANQLYQWEERTMAYFEVIPPGVDSTAKLKINTKALNLKIPKENTKLKEKVRIVDLLEQPEKLLQVINKHYKSILEKELAYWEQHSRLNEDEEEIIDMLKSDLLEIMAEIDKCDKNEAVLRVGSGSGYLMLTGELLNKLVEQKKISDTDRRAVISQLRDRRGKNYGNAPFPKTRKICSDGHLMGFIKIKLSPL